jgi:trimethylamine--corrinoid protein Co-methyltransferase
MDNYELWEEKGSPDSYKLANSRWKQMLEEYQPPTLDEAIAEEMQEFVSQRRDELRERKVRTEWRHT